MRRVPTSSTCPSSNSLRGLPFLLAALLLSVGVLWSGGVPEPARLFLTIGGLLLLALLRVPLSPGALFALAFLLWLNFSLLLSSAPAASWEGWKYVAIGPLFYLLGLSLPRIPYMRALLLDALIGLALLSSAFGWFVLYAKNFQGLLSGTFFWHNPFATFIGMALLLLPFRFPELRPRARLIYALVGLFLLVSLLFARSVGALLAFCAGALWLGLRLPVFLQQQARRVRAAALGILAILVIAAVLHPGFRARISGILTAGYSYRARVEFWRASTQLWQQKPLTGWGLHTFGSLFPQYQRSIDVFSDDPHNWYLQLLAELGLIGLLLFGAWFLASALTWRQRIHISDLGLEAAVLLGVSHFFLDFDWKFPGLIAFWAFLLGFREHVSARSLRGLFVLPLFLPAAFWLRELPYTRLQKPIPYEVAIRNFPLNYSLLYQQAKLWLEKDLLTARRYLRHLLRVQPYAPDVYFLMAESLRRENRLAGARVYLQQALSLDPRNRPYLAAAYVKIVMALGDLKEAEKWARTFAEFFPTCDPEVLFRQRLEFRQTAAHLAMATLRTALAEIYRTQGRNEEAAREMQCAQRLRQAT